MDNLEMAREEEAKYKNTLVLDHFKVVLLLSIDIEEDDYYYRFMEWKGKWYQSSFVMRLIPLIDTLSKENYNYLASVWNLNNEVKAKEIP